MSGTFYDFGVVVQETPDNAVELVDLYFARGKSAGTSTLQPVVVLDPIFSAPAITGAVVTVSGSDATGGFQNVSMVVMSRVDWTTYGPSRPVLRNWNPLDSVGETQLIFPTYAPSGYILTRSQSEGAVLSVGSPLPSTYRVTKRAAAGVHPYWEGVVPPEAIDSPIDRVLHLTTTLTPAAIGCALNPGHVNISLPTPVSAVLTLQQGDKTAAFNDPAAGIYLPSELQGLRLVVVFSDATASVFTGDDRTQYVFDTNPFSAAIVKTPDQGTGGTAVLGAPSTATPHQITFHATFMGGLVTSNTVTVTVVVATGLAVQVKGVPIHYLATAVGAPDPPPLPLPRSTAPSPASRVSRPRSSAASTAPHPSSSHLPSRPK